MTGHTLAGRVGVVVGVEHRPGREAAVALAEAGADVAVVTASEETPAEFAANSTANEFWALGRRGIALTTDGGDSGVRHAIEEAGVQLGPVSIVVCALPAPLPASVFSGVRSDPAIVIIVGADVPAHNARELLASTRALSERGLRANAVVASRAEAARAGPALKEHQPPEPMDIARATVYLASDATAAIDGAMVVAEA